MPWSRPVRRRDGAPGPVIVALATLLGGCSGDGVLQYEDLVTSGRLAAHPGVAAGAERLCADEARFAVALEHGTKVQVPLVLGEGAELSLAGCGPRAGSAAGPPEPPAEIWVEVRGPSGLVGERRLTVDGTAWTETVLDLAAQAGGSATLSLRVDSPRSLPVVVSDVAVRHRVAPEDATANPPGSPAGGDGGTQSAARGKQILLVSVDTLRADSLGAGRTPALDAFAARSERFEPHYAAATWTKPSHGTLLTGLPPEGHRAQLEDQALAPDAVTLAERFSRAGFATAGLTFDCLWLDPKFGFDRGFAEYRAVQWRADQAVRETVSWLARHRRQPFFYFLHLFTPHSDKDILPYEARGTTRYTVGQRFGVHGYGCREGVCASGLLRSLDAGRVEPIPEEEEILRFLYAGGVSDADRALGRLFRDLDEAGLLENLLVVVTSDHGEAFFEHGKLLHSTPHEEILRVPLLVKWPGGRRGGEVRSLPTSSVDVAPTLLAAAGLEAPELPGIALQDLQRSDQGRGASSRAEGRRALFAGTARKAVVAGPWKAIVPVLDGEPELYRLDRDPGERENLAAEHPEVLERLKKRMVEHVEASRALTRGAPDAAFPEGSLSPEERRRLEALGYLQ
ncbi:MAG: sulfatase-like hydrolase/transferase [Thermoanaerobaculia bacterium]